MSKARLIKDDLKYVLFGEVYFRLQEPKARRKALSIVEATITCIARKGFNDVSLEMIAREAGITKSLLRYYFTNAAELREVAVKYVRLVAQRVILDGLTTSSDPKVMLEIYVDRSFQWVDHFGAHARVWLAFLSLCSHSRSHRTLNDEAVKVACDRLEAILKAGIERKIFRPMSSSDLAARAVLSQLKGSLVAYVSETISKKAYVESVKRHVLLLAGTTTRA